MTDKELFNEVLGRFVEKYGLEVERPYNDGYIEISRNGEQIGSFNTDGYNLLYNLSRLCKVLSAELI